MVQPITGSALYSVGKAWVRICSQKLRALASVVQNFVIRIFRGVIPTSKKLEMALPSDETMIRLVTQQMGESFRKHHAEMAIKIRQIGKELSDRFAKEEMERNKKLRAQYSI